MRRLYRIVLLMTAMLGSTIAMAQKPDVEATLSADSVGIGDRFTLSITVDRDLMQIVEFPEFESKQQGGGIELIENMPVDTLEINNRRLKLRRQYTLTSFDAGRYNIGRAKVLYVDKNITDTLYSADSLRIEIGTFQIDSTSQSIYDLKPQQKMPFRYAEISGYTKYSLLTIVVIALIVVLLMRYLKKRGKKFSDLFKPAPPIPPHIEAITALEQLHNQKLWQVNNHKGYYSGLTDILRRYISRRYGIPAMEMTSDDIIDATRTLDIPNKCSMDLTALLRDADLVKFAKAAPDAEVNEAYYLKSYYFIEETKEQEEMNGQSEDEILTTK